MGPGDDITGGEYRIQINGSGSGRQFLQGLEKDATRASRAVDGYGQAAKRAGAMSVEAFQAASSRAQRVGDTVRQASYAARGLYQGKTTLPVTLSLQDLELAAHAALSSIDQITGRLVRLFSAGVHAAAGVEESNARLKFGLTKIGIAYDDVLKKVDEVSLKTVMTRQEITNMVAGMANAKINVFDKGLDDLVAKVNGKDVKITGAEVIGDAAAKVFGGAERVRRSLTETISDGKVKFGKWLAEDLDLTKDRVKEYNKALAGAKTNQEKFNILVREMNKDVGGAALALGGTLTFALKQVDDWIEKIAFELFKDSLPELRAAVVAAGDAILEFAKGPEIKVIGKAFLDVARVVGYVGMGVLKIGLAIAKFIGQNPALAKFVAILGGAAVAAGFLLAGILATAAAVIAVKAALASIPLVLTAIRAGLFALGPLAAKIAVFTLLATTVAQLIVGGKTMSETWERVGLVISAVAEGIRAMSGDTTKLSMKTAKALADAGLLNLVWTILEYAHAAKQFFVDAKAAVTPYVEGVQAAVRAVMDFVANNPGLVKAVLVGWAAFKAFHLGLALWKGALVAYKLVMAGMPAVMGAVRLALLGMKAALITSGVGAIIVGIATAAYLIYEYWDPIKAFFIGLWESITAAFKTALEWILGKIEWVSDKIEDFKYAVSTSDEEHAANVAAGETETQRLLAQRGINEHGQLGEDDEDYSVHRLGISRETPGAYAARTIHNAIAGPENQIEAPDLRSSAGMGGAYAPDVAAEKIGKSTAKHLARELHRKPLQANMNTKKVNDAVQGQLAADNATGY